MAEEYGVQVPQDGIAVDVDLDILIDHIIVGPEIPPEQQSRVAELAREAGFEGRLRFSTLLGKPRYI